MDDDKTCPACGFDFTLTPQSVYHLTLDMRWPTLNDISNKGGGRWRYKKKRKEFDVALAPVVTALGVPECMPGEYRRVRLARYWAKGRRAYDYDGLVGGAKPLIDLLAGYNLIYSDAPKYFFATYRQQKSPTGEDYITIAVEVFQ